jgi:hypothetical protein
VLHTLILAERLFVHVDGEGVAFSSRVEYRTVSEPGGVPQSNRLVMGALVVPEELHVRREAKPFP